MSKVIIDTETERDLFKLLDNYQVDQFFTLKVHALFDELLDRQQERELEREKVTR